MNYASLLLLAGCLLGSCSTLSVGRAATRKSLIAYYGSVFASHDTNADKRLSMEEVEAMVEIVFPRGRPAAANSSELRGWLIADYAAQDKDKNGYLSPSELLRAPLASFDCMDVNRDDSLSPGEVEGGTGRCPSETD